MKKDFAFPNPLKRTDLPKPRKRWKYVVVAASTVLALVLVFLPQILSSRIGRNLIKMYLENKYQGQVWITEWRTRWFGPTMVYQFSLTDPQSRQIKFTRLETPLPFWRLLLGNYHLGNATVTGLHVEYVVDYGDGADTFDRLPLSPPVKNKAAGPVELPTLSGHLTLKNSTFILTRGEIDEKHQFRTVFRSMRFSGIDGTVDIKSLDQPWTCDLKGRAGPETGPGTIALSGTLDLGEGGKLDLTQARADLTLALKNAPNATAPGTAPLGWLLLPVIPDEDYATSLGQTLQTVDANIHLANGMLSCSKLDVTGRVGDGSATRFSARPALNLVSKPRLLTLSGEATADVLLSRKLIQNLSYVNPLLHDAVEKSGRARIILRDLVMQPGPVPAVQGLHGEVTLHGVTLASGQVTAADAFPREPVTQYQAIVGNSSIGAKLEVPKAEFTLDRSVVSIKPYECRIDGNGVTLSGSAIVGGTFNMLAQIKLPREMQSITGTQQLGAFVTGPIDCPTLGQPASAALMPAISKHLGALRDRRIDQLLQASRNRVQDLLQPYTRMPGPAAER